MRAAGKPIALRKDLLVSHAKVWTLAGLLRSDILDRAVPWTVLQLEYGALLNDLNVAVTQRFAALLAWVVVTCACAGVVWPAFWIASGGAELILAWMNRSQYRFYGRRGGWTFAAGCAAMHLLYYLYSTVAFCAGCVLYLARPATARRDQAGRPV
jgi:hypothetical protein